MIPMGMSSWKCSVTTGVDIPVFKNRRVHVCVCVSVYDQMAVAERKFITPRLWAGWWGREEEDIEGTICSFLHKSLWWEDGKHLFGIK